MKSYHFDPHQHQDLLLGLFQALSQLKMVAPRKVDQVIKQWSKPTGDRFSKDQLIMSYQHFRSENLIPALDARVLELLQMKPVRTQSGVTPLTVLTKPFPCPGKCIFCPNDIRMPKSYLADEPGAQRAERNFFDPYLQTYNRLQAFHNTGHPIAKVEIIVLGGTWSYYPEPYQIWFIKECFRALNDYGLRDDRTQIEKHYEIMNQALVKKAQYAPSNQPQQNQDLLQAQTIDGRNLEQTYNQVVSELYVAPERLGGFDAYQSATWEAVLVEQHRNETAACRNVGLVIETRPDNISEAEVVRIRKLGCTKAQIGFQSLNDDVLEKNKRGHAVAATRRAVNLLRQAGFKIHAHWMANLYGSSVALDRKDFVKLFQDSDFKPDELKIYPCSLIGSAELMQYYQQGLWQPYTYEELLAVLTFCLQNTPQYCRLTRVIRDIPSTDIIEGNKLTNFRQIAEQALAAAGEFSQDIRAREVRNDHFDPNQITLDVVEYDTSVSQERFLQMLVPDSRQAHRPPRLLAFLRLSLPTQPSFIAELQGAALIREVHVYGQTVALGERAAGKAQHLGLGTRLLQQAQKLAQEAGFKRLAVISAVGTREYYRKRGFTDGELYQFLESTSPASATL